MGGRERSDHRKRFQKQMMLTTHDQAKREVAQPILDLAEQTCPYSKATRGNIDVAINLIDTGTAG